MVSVILPVYNVAPYLSKCLDSLLVHQEGVEIEVVAVDDGSTDHSEEILKSYAKRFDNLRVYTQANQGVSVARNVGLDHASGEYILFVDPDDWLEPGAVEKLLALSLVNASDIVIYNYNTVDEVNTCKKVSFITENQGYQFSDRSKYEVFFRKYGLLTFVANCLYKSALLRAIRFEKYPNGEDVLFSFMALARASSVYCTTDAFYNYLRRRESASSQPSIKRETSSLMVMERCLDEIETHITASGAKKVLLQRIKGWVFPGSLMCIMAYSKADRTLIRNLWLQALERTWLVYYKQTSGVSYWVCRVMFVAVHRHIVWMLAVAAARLVLLKKRITARERR